MASKQLVERRWTAGCLINNYNNQRSINYHVNYGAFNYLITFTPNTILLHIISLFKKTVVLIILNKTENHKDLCFKYIHTFLFFSCAT